MPTGKSIPNKSEAELIDQATAQLLRAVKEKAARETLIADSKSSGSHDIERKFREYADKWYAETARDSSLTRITSNVNYLKVIKLGSSVVPLILRELQSPDPAPWFLALRVLTEETNVGREYPGDFRRMAEAWISWGKARALV